MKHHDDWFGQKSTERKMKKDHFWRDNKKIKYLLFLLQAGGYYVYRWSDTAYVVSPSLCIWSLITKVCLTVGCVVCMGTFVLGSTLDSENIGEYTTNVSYFVSCSTLFFSNFALLASSQLLTKLLLSLDKMCVEVLCCDTRRSLSWKVIQSMTVTAWLMAVVFEALLMATVTMEDPGLVTFIFSHITSLNLVTILTMLLFQSVLRFLGSNLTEATKETINNCFLTMTPAVKCYRRVIPVSPPVQVDEDTQVQKLLRLENIIIMVSIHGLF